MATTKNTKSKNTKRGKGKSPAKPAAKQKTANLTGLEIFLALVLVTVLALLLGAIWGYILRDTTQVVSPPVGAQSIPSAQALPVMQPFQSYESEGGIPFNGSEWNADVAPDEMEVLTGGPMTISGVSLPGGETRGSVIILLPGTKVVSYKVTNLLPGSNWHASYRPNMVDESTWRALANDRVAAMQQAPNCHPGTGCKTLDVLVVGPTGVVAQWTVSN